MKKFVFLFSLPLFVTNLVAQSDFKPGYLITLTGDTLQGLIDYRGDSYNATTCLFKASDSGAKTNYNPSEIRAYRVFDKKYYISREITIESIPRKVFLEFLVDGKADLYYLPDNIYFIETEDQPLRILENKEKIINVDNTEYFKQGNEFIGVLSVYLKDAPELRKDIDKLKLDQSQLIDITTRYHNSVCPDEMCMVYVKSRTGTEKRMGISIGTDYNLMRFYSLQSIYYDPEYELFESTTMGPAIAFHFDMFTKGTFERMFTSLTLGYSQFQHSSSSTNFTADILYRNISLSYVFNYIYPKYRLKPYAGLGVCYYHTLNNTKSTIGKYAASEYEPGRKVFGPELDLGLVYMITDRLSLKYSLSYLYGRWNAFADSNFAATTNNANMNLAILYSLNP